MSRADRGTKRLTTTSYAVLAQLALRPWSTYELARQRVRYFRYVWPRAESAIYREVKRLDAMGLASSRKERTGKRARTVYTITEAGERELRAWLDTPVSPFAMEFEAMIRLFIAPLGSKEQILNALGQVRADTGEMLAFGGEVRQEFLEGRARLQEYVHIRALAIDFFISLITTVDEWAERTMQEIEGWEDLTPEGKIERAMEILERQPVPAPQEPIEDPAAPATQEQRRRRPAGRRSPP